MQYNKWNQHGKHFAALHSICSLTHCASLHTSRRIFSLFGCFSIIYNAGNKLHSYIGMGVGQENTTLCSGLPEINKEFYNLIQLFLSESIVMLYFRLSVLLTWPVRRLNSILSCMENGILYFLSGSTNTTTSSAKHSALWAQG